MIFWLTLTLLCIVLEAHYTMGEMATISFSRIRLHYYLSQGKQSAKWIYALLEKPTRLFGTALIGSNLAMQLGSECSRQLYASVGFNPDVAFLSQFALVIIFAELAPLFAARRWSEQIAIALAPMLRFSSLLFFPFIWFFGLLVSLTGKLSRTDAMEKTALLSREELQRVLEQQEEASFGHMESDEVNVVVRNLFSLHGTKVKDIMVPLESLRMLPSSATVEEVRDFCKKVGFSSIPIFHRYRTNIIAVAHHRWLIRANGYKKVRDVAKGPWFVSHSAPVGDILSQFRAHQQQAAIVLADNGQAIGMITLRDVLRRIFGDGFDTTKGSFVERHISASMTLTEFSHEFGQQISEPDVKTLSDLLIKLLGHHPEPGESAQIGPFELVVEESTILGIARVCVRSRSM